MDAASKCHAHRMDAVFIPDRSGDWAKRAFDVVCSSIGLFLLSPVFLFIAAAIKCCDRGPVFYRQVRVGLNGIPFRILKFRTMVDDADKAGPSVTKDCDPRITRVGKVLRKTKLDELPQLWNVLCGEMSFVGPRPEVPRYVALYTSREQPILKLKPGITDLASLSFRNEEQLLRNASNVELFYMEVCVPKKARLNLEYAQRANLISDILLIFRTLVPESIRIIAIYGMALFLSLLIATALLQPGTARHAPRLALLFSMLVVPVQMFFLLRWKQHRVLPAVMDVSDIRDLGRAVGASCASLALFSALVSAVWVPSLNLIAIDSALAFVALLGIRMMSMKPVAGSSQHGSRVAIIGANPSGARIAADFVAHGSSVKAFFDDDAAKWHKCINGVTVAGMPESLLTDWREQLDEVAVALPGASQERLKELRNMIGRAGLKVVSPAWLGNQTPKTFH